MNGFKESVKEAIRAVMPITLMVLILQVVFLSMPIVASVRFFIGAMMVMTGLGLFLRGARIGLLPMGEVIGSELPKRGSVAFLVVLTFILGFSVTLAEPTIRVLGNQMGLVAGDQVNENVLILTAASGAGIFLCLAALRILLQVPMAYLLAGSYALVLILSAFAPTDVVPIAFDAGGAATGPISAPFFIALGIGITSVLGHRSSMADGFGLVGLAAIGPIIGMMIMGIVSQ